MDNYNLLIALLILVCLFIVLLGVYVLNHHVKRNKKKPSQDRNEDLEANPSRRPSLHSGVLQENSSDDSRLSRLTIVEPSIELLPEINTNKDRAEDWLDRRDSRATDGDIRLDPITPLGATDDTKCRDRRDERGAKDDK